MQENIGFIKVEKQKDKSPLLGAHLFWSLHAFWEEERAAAEQRSKVQNTLLHSISSLPPVLASLATLRGEGTAIHTRYSLVPAPSSSCKNPREPFPGWSCSSAQNLEPIYLSSNSCHAAGFLYNLKILILSVFSFQQYITAITNLTNTLQS